MIARVPCDHWQAGKRWRWVIVTVNGGGVTVPHRKNSRLIEIILDTYPGDRIPCNAIVN